MDFLFKLDTLRTRVMAFVDACRHAGLFHHTADPAGDSLAANAESLCMVADRGFVKDYRTAAEYIMGHPLNPERGGLDGPPTWPTTVVEFGKAEPAIGIRYSFEGTEHTAPWHFEKIVPIHLFQATADSLLAAVDRDLRTTRSRSPQLWTIRELPGELHYQAIDLIRAVPKELIEDQTAPIGRAAAMLTAAIHWLRETEQREKHIAATREFFAQEKLPGLRDRRNVDVEVSSITSHFETGLDSPCWELGPGDLKRRGVLDVHITLRDVPIELVDVAVVGYYELLDSLLKAPSLRVDLPQVTTESLGLDEAGERLMLCDCCGEPIMGMHVTHECAGGGDGPGFALCRRSECERQWLGLDAAAARHLFTARMNARKVDRMGTPKVRSIGS